MASRPRLFEMRRMEALSNTVFGVAMTLLAYQVPKEGFVTPDPKWGDIWHSYGSHLLALLLSFIVAGDCGRAPARLGGDRCAGVRDRGVSRP